ncbi:MAG: GNAT family N-acetyltransferase [bacterium]
MDRRYGIINKQYTPFNQIDSIKNVVVAFDDDKSIGCGSFKKFDNDMVEIKRMFVKPEARGSGAAKLILLELEKWAVESGYKSSVLETGIKQPDAIKFYEKNGYSKIENYGQYIGNSNSVCMSKKLL